MSKLGLRFGEKDNFGLKGLARIGPKIKLVFTQPPFVCLCFWQWLLRGIDSKSTQMGKHYKQYP